MPLYLTPKLGGGTVAIAICDRCKSKFHYDELSEDRNSPGLRVCRDCNDEKDPYKLPARESEKIQLKYPRPDEPLE